MITVSNAFNSLASGPVRPLDYELAISFTKALNSEISWFVLDQSVLDGGDLLADNDQNPVQLWDAYDYTKLKDRMVDLSLTRSIQFPYNVQSATAEFTVNNYDHYFSFEDSGSPIGNYILPKRPCRLYMGFKGAGVVPVFVGLTQGMPSYSGDFDEKANFDALDFLSEIGDMKLTNMVMMRNARTDQVIATILNQFGIEPQMYNLAHGLNTIPFVYFDTGKDAGNALRELVQAENGALWLDEQGIIRFEPRTGIIGKEPVMKFDADSIIKITPSRASDIVNYVKVSAEIREVQSLQPIFTVDNSSGYESAAADDDYRVPAGGTTTVWLSLEDPTWSANLPILNGPATDSNFTAVDLSGSPVNSGVTIAGTLFADSYKLEISNTNPAPVSVNYLQLYGEPAKMIGGEPIEYTAYDEESVEKFGNMSIEITDNRCFGSVQNAKNYALDILSKYSDYNHIIKLEVKGSPALQMQDLVTVDYGDYSGTYQILGIDESISATRFSQTLTIIKSEVYSPFILDVSELDGPDVLA